MSKSKPRSTLKRSKTRTHAVSVKLPMWMATELADVADEKLSTVSHVIRLAIRDYLAKD